MTFYLLSCNATTPQCYAINNTRTYVDYVLILNYFVINYISLWRRTATSQPESYGCQKIANFYLIMIFNSGPTRFSYGISSRNCILLIASKNIVLLLFFKIRRWFGFVCRQKLTPPQLNSDTNPTGLATTLMFCV